MTQLENPPAGLLCDLQQLLVVEGPGRLEQVQDNPTALAHGRGGKPFHAAARGMCATDQLLRRRDRCVAILRVLRGFPGFAECERGSCQSLVEG